MGIIQNKSEVIVGFYALFIGVIVGIALYVTIHWWAFLIIFPWIGGCIALAIWCRYVLPAPKKGIGRKICLLLILPILLIFVPVVNRENFQLEGIILIVLVGFFSKGFIHFAVAKLFGPLIWGRGFCGWACWTAAITEWVPVNKKRRSIPGRLRNLRYATLAISILFPLILVVGLHYDVRGEYLHKTELSWMIISNIVYYALAIPMTLYFRDQRAFCKIACPVSLIMKVPTKVALVKKRPSETKCIECGTCNSVCPMDIDVMSYISQRKKVSNTECILCDECFLHCPVGAIK